MTLQEAKKYSMDNGCYPLFFTTVVGLDFKLKTRPELYAKVDNPRKVLIEISSFRGICGWAVHYYARIKADGIIICDDVQTEKGIQTRYLYGYLGEEFNVLPEHQKDLYSPKYTIEVCRDVTAKDLEQNPIRWDGYHVGDKTNAFDTEYAAIRRAQSIVKARFSKFWQVSVEKI